MGLDENPDSEQRFRTLALAALENEQSERGKLARVLHDEVAQTLLGINVRLLSLKKATKGNTASLKKEIDNTQRLVEESIQSIDRFARELDIHQQA